MTPERRNGTYAACTYDHSTSEILKEWMKIWSIPDVIDQKDLHSTIIYSRSPIAPEYQRNLDASQLRQLNWRFLPKELKVIGPAGKQALVLILDAPQLEELHQSLRAIGAQHDFDDYIPHVTLSYKADPSFDYTSIVPPPVYFIPNKVYFEKLDLNWKDAA